MPGTLSLKYTSPKTREGKFRNLMSIRADTLFTGLTGFTYLHGGRRISIGKRKTKRKVDRKTVRVIRGNWSKRSRQRVTTGMDEREKETRRVKGGNEAGQSKARGTR